MADTIVFGGWAVSPDVLKNIWGDDAEYIDINRMMPGLFDDDRRLADDWPKRVICECRSININIDNADHIAGWSTGAMIAYAAARINPPRELTLLSATPCFCRRDDFRFGTRPPVIDQMITNLRNDRDAVLISFYDRCGLSYDKINIPDYTIDELISGLEFLKQADLRPLTPLSIIPTFYHGKDDKIIPPSASKYFSDQTNGNHMLIDGAHAPQPR